MWRVGLLRPPLLRLPGQLSAMTLLRAVDSRQHIVRRLYNRLLEYLHLMRASSLAALLDTTNWSFRYERLNALSTFMI